jgi:hypothetical protein
MDQLFEIRRPPAEAKLAIVMGDGEREAGLAAARPSRIRAGPRAFHLVLASPQSEPYVGRAISSRIRSRRIPLCRAIFGDADRSAHVADGRNVVSRFDCFEHRLEDDPLLNATYLVRISPTQRPPSPRRSVPGERYQ